MRIATWNVNGLRARIPQLLEWLDQERPDVVMLQEIKAAPEQLPEVLHPGYWQAWHGQKGYSGVGMLVSKNLPQPQLIPAEFDEECRALAVELGPLDLMSVYVPNGGRSIPAKLEFLENMRESLQRQSRPLILGGDLNVALTDQDVHPKELDPRKVGQLPIERALLGDILKAGYTDLLRKFHPEPDLFTWWAPWREMRQRNIGWRIDFLLVSSHLAGQASSCDVRKEVGTSDHAPVVAEFPDLSSKLAP